MLLVKLGGSVLTNKTRLRTPRLAAIRRLARELAAVRQPLLVVHGVGSFGHILARRHGLDKGGLSPAKRAAAARVHADVRELDRLVVDALNDAGFAAVPVPPSAVFTLDDSCIATIHLTPFLEFSSIGFPPGMFGALGRPLSGGFSVCSGALLMLALDRPFQTERAVFAADV